MTHQYHFRSGIDKERIDERAEELGFTTRAEYIRFLIRSDLDHE